MHSDRPHFLAVIELQAAVSDRAKAVRLLQDRVKYWREISGRGIDDLQHLGGRGLSVQRFLLLGQQPRVLDGDYGLRSEVLQQRDFFLGERPDLLSGGHDLAEQRVVLAQRYKQRGAKAAELDGSTGHRIVDLAQIGG